MKKLLLVCLLTLLILGPIPAVSEGANPTPTPTAAAGLPQGCRGGDPLANVYQPWRLKVLAPCVEVTGVVKVIYHEPDGDYHVNIILDAPFTSMLNEGNRLDAGGALITEIVPHDQKSVPVPPVGQHVRVVGPWVLDRQHGWNEIHPVWLMQSTTQVAPSLPRNVSPPASSQTCGTRARAPRGGALIQAISLCPEPVQDYLEATITAYVRAGASCTTKVVYARKYAAASGHLRFVRTAGGAGMVTWHWVPETTATGGATVTVSCRAGSARQSMTRAFTLAPGTRPED